MKEWIATHTHDCVNFETKVIKAVNSTEAVVTFEIMYPNEIICDLKEKES